MTSPEKAQLTKEIKISKQVIFELLHECEYQKPQPDGTQYLYGLTITMKWINEEVNHLNKLILLRGQESMYHIIIKRPSYNNIS